MRIHLRERWAAALVLLATLALLGSALALRARQNPAIVTVEENLLREYAGVYAWADGGLVYLQLWDEFSGFGKPKQLVAFDERGDVRVLYPTGRDQFFTGRGAAVATPIESRITFERNEAGRIASCTWIRENAASRSARRVEPETHEDVQFSSERIRLAGTLIRPRGRSRVPAVVLVHGSGAADREYVLPWARFLVRRGMAILAYDKRGVGGSSGDWNRASFEDLAADVVAAFNYLRTRPDIDPTAVGLMGISQAGWVMPAAAVQAPEIAFIISISGAGVTPAETTLDQARNEMTANGMPAALVDPIIDLMTLKYDFARTGTGWERYAAARQQMAARMGGQPPRTFPGTQNDDHWNEVRRTYFFDSGPLLRQLKTPVLALFGELDNNILAAKNSAAWEAALKAGGHRDYTLTVLPKGNHLQLEAMVGNNAEMPRLKRFVPDYFLTVGEWLTKRIRTLDK